MSEGGHSLSYRVCVGDEVNNELTCTGEQLDQFLVLWHVLDRIVDLAADLGDRLVPVLANDSPTHQPLLQLTRVDVDRNVGFLRRAY